MNDWILLAILLIWIPVSVAAITVLLFPDPHSVKAYWKAQNRKEKEDENYDLFV